MNKLQVDLDEVGRIHLSRAGYCNGIYTLETTEALRAFFQAERDQELGWWRDPEEPDWVVYPHEYYNDTVVVYNERTRSTSFPHRSATETSSGNCISIRVAKRYFAAHPDEETHKPWEEAKPGEVWVLTRWGTAEPFLVTGGEFITADLAVIVDLDDDSITAGRRIWPEPNGSGDES